MNFNLAKYVVSCRAMVGQWFGVVNRIWLAGKHQLLAEMCLGRAEVALNMTDVSESRVSLWKTEVFSIHFFLLLPLCGPTLPERWRDGLVEHLLPSSEVGDAASN